MTTQPHTREDGLVPFDSFGNRLALVRAHMGWNYDQAEDATTVGSESWRTWEKGMRQCSTEVEVARKISAATGISASWIAFGGSLAPAPPKPRRRRGHATHPSAETSAYRSAVRGKVRNLPFTQRTHRCPVLTPTQSGHTRRAA